jgi:hypothetical protein
MDWIAHVTEALFSTYRGASKLPDEILAVEGYSSPLVRRLLNNPCDFDGCRYVEVGTWQGATALSASYLNRGSFNAIDNDVLAMWNVDLPITVGMQQRQVVSHVRMASAEPVAMVDVQVLHSPTHRPLTKSPSKTVLITGHSDSRSRS